VDEAEWWIVFPAWVLASAEVQQIAQGVEDRVELLEAARDERADVRHRVFLPEAR
jgi:hypothetical protein